MRYKDIAVIGAAYFHKPSGKILGPEMTHADFYWNNEMKKLVGVTPDSFEDDIDEIAGRMFDMMDTGDLVDGFVTNSGKFLDRDEAKEFVKIKDKSRDWVDSEDLF